MSDYEGKYDSCDHQRNMQISLQDVALSCQLPCSQCEQGCRVGGRRPTSSAASTWSTRHPLGCQNVLTRRAESLDQGSGIPEDGVRRILVLLCSDLDC